jgi:hypothetical protein
LASAFQANAFQNNAFQVEKAGGVADGKKPRRGSINDIAPYFLKERQYKARQVERLIAKPSAARIKAVVMPFVKPEIGIDFNEIFENRAAILALEQEILRLKLQMQRDAKKALLLARNKRNIAALIIILAEAT